MRHLIGFMLALITCAAVFAGGGWGTARLTALAARGGSLTGPTGVLALAAVLGVGLLLGVLITVRAISPLAAGLPGLAMLGWTAFLVVSAHRAVGWFPLAGWTPWLGARALLDSGGFALLGVAMVIPMCLPSRWRGARDGEGGEDEEDVLPAPTGMLT